MLIDNDQTWHFLFVGERTLTIPSRKNVGKQVPLAPMTLTSDLQFANFSIGKKKSAQQVRIEPFILPAQAHYLGQNNPLEQ